MIVEIREIEDLKWVKCHLCEVFQGAGISEAQTEAIDDIEAVLTRCIERLEAKFEMARFMLSEKP